MPVYRQVVRAVAPVPMEPRRPKEPRMLLYTEYFTRPSESVRKYLVNDSIFKPVRRFIGVVDRQLVGIRLLCVDTSLSLEAAVIPPAFRAVNQKIVPYDTAVGRGIGKAYAALFPGA